RLAGLLLLPALCADAADPFVDTVKPFLTKQCASCHAGNTPAGGLTIAALTSRTAIESLKDRERWERIAQRLKSGEMPPKGMPRPDAQSLKTVVTWIDQSYEALDRTSPVDPGRVTARRLNRFEYTNSVRDLLGIDLNPAEDFPVDPYGYGFDNIG